MFLRKAVQTSSRRFSTYPAFIANTPATEVSKTANGVRVASEAAHGETATVSVSINAGSRHESDANAGAAHFLQHMAVHDGKAQGELESMGAQFNCSTSRENTVYSATVLKKDVGKAVQVLAGVVQNATHDDAALAAHKERVLSASGAHSFTDSIQDELHTTAFMGTGLGRTALGADENIRNLTGAHLSEFAKQHHTGDRVVLAAAGAVDHKQLAELANTHFASMAASGAPLSVPRARFTGSDKRIRYDSMSSAHVALAFEGASLNSEFLYPLKLIQTMVGSWDRTSATARNAGSKFAIDASSMDLAHNFSSFNTCYQDTGLFGIVFQADDNKLEDTMFYTLDNLVRFCHNVGDDELKRAKVQLMADTMKGLDSSAHVAEEIGLQMLAHGRRMTHAEIYARVEALTAEDIKATANNIINDEDHALAAIGPIFELPDYNWIRRRSYYNRF